MSILNLFSRTGPTRVFIAILLGAAAGISYAFLIPTVLTSLASRSIEDYGSNESNAHFLGIYITNYRFALLFAATCGFILFARTLSQLLLARIALETARNLRKEIYEKISRTDIHRIELVGVTRVLSAINVDIARIIAGSNAFPGILISCVSILSMLAYLLVINKAIFLAVAESMAFGLISYQLPLILGRRLLTRNRHEYELLQNAAHGLIMGIKELRLNSKKLDFYFRSILDPGEEAVLRSGTSANHVVAATLNYGDLLGFFVIGFISFIFVSYHAVDSQIAIGSVMAILYITAPTGLILGSIPIITNAHVSLNNLNGLFDELDAQDVRETEEEIGSWEEIVFQNVRHSYKGKGGEPGFDVGPLSFSIKRGEILFIIGGNGSGKTTAGKLIALHYKPTSGQVRFGNEIVSVNNISSARDSIAAIFTDFFLFDRLLDAIGPEQSVLIDRFLMMLNIHHKVKIKEGKFSSADLSDGQRKRLALLIAFLEDKHLYVFDEWAADQDPEFKTTFYYKILPELKAQGKAVVVISHDDQYFSAADRIIVMSDGAVLSDSSSVGNN